MKTSLIYTTGATLLNVRFNFLPSVDLFVIMLMLTIIDFATGVLKAIIKKEARTSEGYRKTIVKVFQYGGAIAVSMTITYLAKTNPEFVQLGKYSSYIGNGLLLFIIFIELTSILENLYEVDKKSVASRYIIYPAVCLFTLKLNNIRNLFLNQDNEKKADNEESK